MRQNEIVSENQYVSFCIIFKAQHISHNFIIQVFRKD